MTTQTKRHGPRIEQRHDAETSGGGNLQPDAGTREGTTDHADELENYAGGYIQAHHGRINAWLVVVIVVLLVWALYYGFTYWGGLGEGLDY